MSRPQIDYGRMMGRFYWHCWSCDVGGYVDRLSLALVCGREHLERFHA